jgi:hypothetical protein
MAELAFGIIGKVLKKLGLIANQQFSLAGGVKSDLTRLERNMSFIREMRLRNIKNKLINTKCIPLYIKT